MTLNGANTEQLTFTVDTLDPGAAEAMHDFSLVVTDDEGAISEDDELTITVESPNAAPIANAGPDQKVASGATVTHQLRYGGYYESKFSSRRLVPAHLVGIFASRL